MNDKYKKMLERFEQICQNAKKELCGKKEKELEKRFIKKINKELTINGYDEIEYWLASVEALDNNAVNDILEENKRLNNIINELEKDFERKIQSCTIEAETTTNDFYCRLHIATLKRWLNKIKELKGSAKE